MGTRKAREIRRQEVVQEATQSLIMLSIEPATSTTEKDKGSSELTKIVEEASTRVTSDDIVTSLKDVIDCQNNIKDLVLTVQQPSQCKKFTYSSFVKASSESGFELYLTTLYQLYPSLEAVN